VKKLLCILLALTVSGCTITKPVLDVRVEQGPVYDQLYPYYFEIFAVSQLKPIGQEEGGRHGHAAVYLKGVCRDESAPYPQIKMCDEMATDLTNPESGVGVSVDKIFKTVNWVAVPGKKLFVYGDLEPDQTLDRASLDAAVLKAERLGLFKGIKLHEDYLQKKPEGMSEATFIARETLATDYALAFGRSIFTTKLPVTRLMMEKAVSFLNALNRKYADGEMDYEWSGYSDNCAHTVHNALAAAGVWKAKSVKSVSWRFFSGIAVPANEFAELAFLANLYPLEKAGKIKRDKIMMQTLLEQNWLPMRHGALVSIIPVHARNDFYKGEFTAFLLDRPLTKKKTRQLRELVTDKRFTDLRENLACFGDRYDRVLKSYCEDEAKCLCGEKDVFNRAYCRYLRAQLEDTNNKLKRITTEGSL
jgi:hypothetical protein